MTKWVITKTVEVTVEAETVDEALEDANEHAWQVNFVQVTRIDPNLEATPVFRMGRGLPEWEDGVSGDSQIGRVDPR